MFTTKYTSKGKQKSGKKGHSEDVGNFYVRKPSLGKSPETRMRHRMGDYGKKPMKQDTEQLPIWISGFNI